MMEPTTYSCVICNAAVTVVFADTGTTLLTRTCGHDGAAVCANLRATAHGVGGAVG